MTTKQFPPVKSIKALVSYLESREMSLHVNTDKV